MNKKISIITVVKNGMPFLKSAIKSFDLQTYDNKELIIVYAPSSDGTENFLDSLVRPNIKIFKDAESINKFGSLNMGLNLAKGEILGLLHADDIFYNEKTLEDISKNFNNIDLLYGDVLFSHKKDLGRIIRVWRSTDFKKFFLKFGWMPPHTSMFISKNFIVNNKCYYSERFPISGDYDYILKILNKPNLKTLYLRNFISVMRAGGDSTKISNIFKKINEDLKISKKYYKNNFFCIFFKILQKIFQIQIVKKTLINDYINLLKRID